ncbi:MAG: carotenoid oxygenase family protein, partial [Candidatus Competibacteraceae bacterium]|nr:carotenoid oxygenase family protein [Candidatus Competibacteraceae bacterium]
AASRGPGSGFLDQVVRLDLEHGSRAAVWEQADGFTGEPLFVPRPGSHDETEGIVLCQVLDAAARRSLLLGLEAESLEEVARATLPHVVPFNFHGHYFRPGEFHDTVG